MEIIDMASVALKNKDQEPPGSAPLSQIRDKVLEHSHRPIHLRKGDFYSYLSLSSHDSDCGEVSTCTEDKSSTPLPYDVSDTPDFHDEELLFQACTEEVYLGPPLCYTMSMPKKQNLKSRACLSPETIMDGAPLPACTEYQKAPGISPGSTAGSQLECHNEAAYLNPLPCETLIDTVECFADTKMLESNISPVMTKIRVSCSSTNPLKEEGSLYINPKINCPQIRKSDRDEKGPASQRMKQKNVRKGCSSLQEAKSTHKQSPRPEQALAREARAPAEGPSLQPRRLCFPEPLRRAGERTRQAPAQESVRRPCPQLQAQALSGWGGGVAPRAPRPLVSWLHPLACGSHRTGPLAVLAPPPRCAVFGPSSDDVISTARPPATVLFLSRTPGLSYLNETFSQEIGGRSGLPEGLCFHASRASRR
ncbi:hypothetical protein ANANG_G00019790 [Anguilla anguilla]|uniref:Uncharacterized protein n=1 Tax=Anguilla anguilla TaxID=7936 RepID=A0A9D3MYY6_ANGAN|nr:hypothetical protein ANANG_G00019790 [Anguilla anguilla]